MEEKYDALRDKLLLEALEKQMGAAEWARLSEQERQARLAKMKLQERRLRQQGRFDDAAALLGEGLKNAEALQVLFNFYFKKSDLKFSHVLTRYKTLMKH